MIDSRPFICLICICSSENAYLLVYAYPTPPFYDSIFSCNAMQVDYSTSPDDHLGQVIDWSESTIRSGQSDMGCSCLHLVG